MIQSRRKVLMCNLIFFIISFIINFVFLPTHYKPLFVLVLVSLATDFGVERPVVRPGIVSSAPASGVAGVGTFGRVFATVFVSVK